MIVELSQVRDLMLVNQEHPISWNPQSLVLVGGRVLMDERAACALNKLMEELDGWNFITAVSGWRSQEEQHEIYIRSLWESGEEFTKQFVARPGHSEHQTGLAIDLGLTQLDIDFLRPYFPYEGICQTFRERAAAYGFIERYPAGKEAVTGIAHEPWHFRYVGVPHAEIMVAHGWTLEEYHKHQKPFSLEVPT